MVRTKEEINAYNRKWKKSYYERNRELVNRKVRAYRLKNKERLRQERFTNKEKYAGYKLKGRYGITFEDKIRMIKEQDNKCGICGDLLDGYKNAFVDHNHFNKQIRGILCKRCNFAIGFSRENKEIMRKMIEYIEKYETIANNNNLQLKVI